LSHVSTMGKIFEEVFTKPEFNLDDFLDHTYATVSGFARVVSFTS
jgi:U3 small nucleolar RNA-associated protein 19